MSSSLDAAAQPRDSATPLPAPCHTWEEHTCTNTPLHRRPAVSLFVLNHLLLQVKGEGHVADPWAAGDGSGTSPAAVTLAGCGPVSRFLSRLRGAEIHEITKFNDDAYGGASTARRHLRRRGPGRRGSGSGQVAALSTTVTRAVSRGASTTSTSVSPQAASSHHRNKRVPEGGREGGMVGSLTVRGAAGQRGSYIIIEMRAAGR